MKCIADGFIKIVGFQYWTHPISYASVVLRNVLEQINDYVANFVGGQRITRFWRAECRHIGAAVGYDRNKIDSFQMFCQRRATPVSTFATRTVALGTISNEKFSACFHIGAFQVDIRNDGMQRRGRLV